MDDRVFFRRLEWLFSPGALLFSKINDPEGRYLRGWFVPNSRVHIDIALPRGIPEGIEARTADRSIFTYSAAGELLSERGAHGQPEVFRNGRYEIIALSMRWFAWFFVSPVYTWLLAAAGFAGIAVLEVLRRRRIDAVGTADPSSGHGGVSSKG